MTFGQPLAISRPEATSSSDMPQSNHDMHQNDITTPSYAPMSDHSLYTDMRMYASSPNSLYMYEQERSDMQWSMQQDLCKASLTGELCKLERSDRLGSCGDMSIEGDFAGGLGSTSSALDLDLEGDVFHEWSAPPLESTMEDMTLVRDVVWPEDGSSCLLPIDDVFQVDKDDLIAGPTLAQLNCDISVTSPDDLLNVGIKQEKNGHSLNSMCGMIAPSLSSVKSYPVMLGSVSTTSVGMDLRTSSNRKATTKTSTVTSPCDRTEQSAPVSQNPASQHRYPACLALWSTNMTQNTTSAPSSTITTLSTTDKKTSLQKLLMQPAGGSTVMSTSSLKKRSRSSDSNSSVEKKWQEVKQFIHDEPPAFTVPSSAKKPKTEPVDDDDDSNDEGFDSDIGGESEAEDDHDWSSDAESVDSSGSFVGLDDYKDAAKRNDSQCFWMYNMQSKGPKGKRLCVSMQTSDPHVITEFADPVFDSSLAEVGYKHSGKVRRGDGNDTTPNPRKLWSIGRELRKLNYVINDLTPVSELPVNVRPKSRREKNKLASRACRLKKKAQHEANKVKLYGIRQEHQNLLSVISAIKEKIARRLEQGQNDQEGPLTTQMDALVKTHLKQMIAGNTMEFVNSVIAKVEKGDPCGGLIL